MIRRIAVVAVLAAIALAHPSQALAAPTNGDARVVSVNRQLAALAATPPQAAPQTFQVRQPTAAAVAPPAGRSILLSPAVLAMASRYTAAERLLHFQSHGFDANLWGALNSSRSIRIHYVVHF